MQCLLVATRPLSSLTEPSTEPECSFGSESELRGSLILVFFVHWHSTQTLELVRSHTLAAPPKATVYEEGRVSAKMSFLLSPSLPLSLAAKITLCLCLTVCLLRVWHGEGGNRRNTLLSVLPLPLLPRHLHVHCHGLRRSLNITAVLMIFFVSHSPPPPPPPPPPLGRSSCPCNLPAPSTMAYLFSTREEEERRCCYSHQPRSIARRGIG